VQFCCTAKSHPTEITIPQAQCSFVVQPSLIPQKSIYRKISAALLYRLVSSHSSHHTASSVLLCCTDKSHPTAVTIQQVQCSSVVQPSLIPQHSLYYQFRSALFSRQDSSHSIHYTTSSVQLCCTDKPHPTAITILPVLVQLCCTDKSHPSEVTILPVSCSSVVQPSLIPLQSLFCQFSAALLYRPV